MAPGRPSALLPLAVLAALTAGCGSDEQPAGPALDVVATTSIAADIVSQVGGDDAEVTELIPDSVSPHDFQASAQDRQRIADADLLVEFGTGLEATVPDDVAPAIFRFTDHAGDLRDDGDDPHIWMDPTRIAATVPALAAELADAAPENEAGYEIRGRRYVERLGKLDRQIAELAETVPSQNRSLVTSHDALGYFADRYGLEVVATPFGLSPEAEASAEDLENVIRVVEAEDVPAVFVEHGDDPQVLQRVAGETGVKVVDDLLVEGFGPRIEAYLDMVRFTATRILDALGAKGT